MSQVDFTLIGKLELTSTYKVDHDRLIYIDDNWNEFTELEYEGIIRLLRWNQLDPILNGFGYNQTDIRRHLNKLR